MTPAELKRWERREFWRSFAIGLFAVLVILAFVAFKVFIGWDGAGAPLR